VVLWNSFNLICVRPFSHVNLLGHTAWFCNKHVSYEMSIVYCRQIRPLSNVITRNLENSLRYNNNIVTDSRSKTDCFGSDYWTYIVNRPQIWICEMYNKCLLIRMTSRMTKALSWPHNNMPCTLSTLPHLNGKKTRDF